MSHGFRHKYTRTLAGRCIIPARPPAPSATSSPPLGCLCAAAPRSSAPVRVRIQGWTWPPARFPAARIAPCHFVAAADATCKTNILRFPARDRTAVPFAHWPPARLSVCANTSVFFLPSLQYPAPLFASGRAVHQPLTFQTAQALAQFWLRPKVGEV